MFHSIFQNYKFLSFIKNKYESITDMQCANRGKIISFLDSLLYKMNFPKYSIIYTLETEQHRKICLFCSLTYYLGSAMHVTAITCHSESLI